MLRKLWVVAKGVQQCWRRNGLQGDGWHFSRTWGKARRVPKRRELPHSLAMMSALRSTATAQSDTAVPTTDRTSLPGFNSCSHWFLLSFRYIQKEKPIRSAVEFGRRKVSAATLAGRDRYPRINQMQHSCQRHSPPAMFQTPAMLRQPSSCTIMYRASGRLARLQRRDLLSQLHPEVLSVCHSVC